MSNDALIRSILETVKVIAMVGASARPERPAHGVMAFLIDRGFTVIPVNPRYAGQTIHGQRVHAALADIPVAVDMVDIFRRSEAAGEVTDQAIAIGARVVWMQIGVRDDAAAGRARAAGLHVIMNRCPAIELRRLQSRRA